MASENGPATSGVSVRAVCIGLAGTVVLAMVQGYNDEYLRNTQLSGNHFPVAAIAALGALVLAVNAAVRRWGRTPGLGPGELVLIWSMLAVAGGIGAAGLMRYFPPWMVTPAYYAQTRPEFAESILPYVPDWLLVGKRAGDPAVAGYMEGLSAGEAIPWSAWAAPMFAWFGFVLLLYAAAFVLTSVFYRQWAVHERLVFPIARLPVELAAAPRPGEAVNAFLRNPATWAGIAIPAVLHSMNSLHEWVPAVPSVPLGWWAGGFFAERPWSELTLHNATVYFTVTGLTFLLTAQTAFSFWFFYVLYRATYVLVAWLGAGAGGFWGDWSYRSTVFGIAGVQLVLGGFLFWTARRHLWGWVQRAIRGRSDPAVDVFAPRFALGVLLLAVAAMMAWTWFAGAQWWVAAAGILVFLAGMLVTTRVVAESGLLFVNNNVVPYDAVTGLVPASWVSGGSATALMMHKSVVMADARELLMPYLMHGARAADQAASGPSMARRTRAVLGALALTAVVAVAAAAYAKIAIGYKYGGVNLDPWANVWQPDSYLGTLHRYVTDPPRYDRIVVGNFETVPANAAHVGLGAAAAGGLLWLQSRFLWWPLHPFGLVMCAAWSTSVIWFSIFLGWLANVVIRGFGGAAAYRRALPFFLGLALGEALTAGFWTLGSLLMGQPARPFLPG